MRRRMIDILLGARRREASAVEQERHAREVLYHHVGCHHIPFTVFVARDLQPRTPKENR